MEGPGFAEEGGEGNISFFALGGAAFRQKPPGLAVATYVTPGVGTPPQRAQRRGRTWGLLGRLVPERRIFLTSRETMACSWVGDKPGTSAGSVAAAFLASLGFFEGPVPLGLTWRRSLMVAEGMVTNRRGDLRGTPCGGVLEEDGE